MRRCTNRQSTANQNICSFRGRMQSSTGRKRGGWKDMDFEFVDEINDGSNYTAGSHCSGLCSVHSLLVAYQILQWNVLSVAIRSVLQCCTCTWHFMDPCLLICVPAGLLSALASSSGGVTLNRKWTECTQHIVTDTVCFHRSHWLRIFQLIAKSCF